MMGQRSPKWATSMLPGSLRAMIAAMLAGWLMEVSATPFPDHAKIAALQKLLCALLDSQTKCKSLTVSIATRLSSNGGENGGAITTKEQQQPQPIKASIIHTSLDPTKHELTIFSKL